MLLRSKQRLAKAFRQLPFLIPISWQCTNDEPCKAIYQRLAALESERVPTLSFAPGFPAADFPDCGPSVFAYGRTQADADAAGDSRPCITPMSNRLTRRVSMPGAPFGISEKSSLPRIFCMR